MAKLTYSSHNQRGRADIFVDGGKPSERVVGRSSRTPFPMGGYVYTITDRDGREVYCGNSMKAGLEALEKTLDQERAQ